MIERFIRVPEAKLITGLSRATIYRNMERGSFPQSTKLSDGQSGAIGWPESAIQKWVDDRTAGVSA